MESDSYGSRDDDVFENFLLAELNAMEASLSGMEIMDFKYSIEEGEEQPPTQYVKMQRVVFRDSLVEAFRWGMRGHK